MWLSLCMKFVPQCPVMESTGAVRQSRTVSFYGAALADAMPSHYVINAEIAFPKGTQDPAARVYRKMQDPGFWKAINPSFTAVEDRGVVANSGRRLFMIHEKLVLCGCCRFPISFPAEFSFEESSGSGEFVVNVDVAAGAGVVVHHTFRVQNVVHSSAVRKSPENSAVVQDSEIVLITDEVSIDAPCCLLGYVTRTARQAHEAGLQLASKYTEY